MRLWQYIYFRIVAMILQFIGGLVIVLYIVRVIPYNPIPILLWGFSGTDEERNAAIAALKHMWGIDQPIHVQLWQYLVNFATTGALGDSWYGGSVNAMIGTSLEFTFGLTAFVMVFVIPLSLYLGIISAKRSQSKLDLSLKLISSIIYGVPYYIFGVLFLLLIDIEGWKYSKSEFFWLNLSALFVILILVFTSYQYRVIRKEFIEVLAQNYILTARAKGLKERTVLYKHAFKNVLPRVVLNYFSIIPVVLSSVMVMEFIFQLPGLGYFIGTLVLNLDWGLLIGLTIILLSTVNVVLMIGDITVKVVDPFDTRRR